MKTDSISRHCLRWKLAAIFSGGLAGLLLILAGEWHFPQWPQLLTALGAGIWASAMLVIAAREIQKSEADDGLAVVLYLGACLLAMGGGSALFYAALHSIMH